MTPGSANRHLPAWTDTSGRALQYPTFTARPRAPPPPSQRTVAMTITSEALSYGMSSTDSRRVSREFTSTASGHG